MEKTYTTLCVADDGIDARVPGSPLYVVTLVDARNRLNADPESPAATPEILSERFHLSLAQVYAALAYYHANQSAFDAELERRREAADQLYADVVAKHGGTGDWTQIIGKWPGDETDEEIEAALERMS